MAALIDTFYAHTPDEDGKWHHLVDHLEEVSLQVASITSWLAQFGQEPRGDIIAFWW